MYILMYVQYSTYVLRIDLCVEDQFTYIHMYVQYVCVEDHWLLLCHSFCSKSTQ